MPNMERPKILVIDYSSKKQSIHYATYPRDFVSYTESMAPFNLSETDNRKVPAGMCYSSGTSGKPKGVMLSHYNLIAYLLTIRASNPLTHNAHMREPFFPSFAHIYGIISGWLLPSWAGNYVQAMRSFDYYPYLRRCSEIGATIVRLVPAAAVRMAKDLEVKKLDLRTVHTIMCSGAPLSAGTIQDLQTVLNPTATVLNGYGMSEGSITILRETRPTMGASVGRPQAGVSIRIVDNEGNDVPLGLDGECWVKSPTVFMGYKGNPTATAEAFRDGWLCTGDVVKVDRDGFFWLTGRKKELIKYKGNQIPPAELEAVLLKHESVVDAGVCGIQAGGDSGELPVACVILSADVDPSKYTTVLENINQYVNERVAPYKRLRGGLFRIDALPKNNSGKLVRKDLAAIVEKLRKRESKL
jgi:4-coumarate--CoA ligase